MTKRIFTITSIVAILSLIVLGAFAVDKKIEEGKAIKIAQGKIIKKVKNHNFLLPDRKLKKLEIEESLSVVVNKKKLSNISDKAAQEGILFEDDFEGGQPNWQASASWGNRAAPGGGLLDETLSDWELVTDNFNSADTSWHETGVTLLQTDMLISPVISLPTDITIGGVTSPLKGVSMDFFLDWDAADPTDQFRVYVGRTDVLWTFDTTDPGTGTSSWICPIPDVAPYEEFVRQFLTTPDIDLTAATAPVNLTFQYKSISEPEFDYNKVDVSTDNFKSFTTVFSHAGGIGTGAVDTWTAVTINLDTFIGSVIKLRFSLNGDFGFVEPGTIFALDEIDVSDAAGSIFHDDGGEAGTSTMEASGFAPGNQLAIFTGDTNPTPAWVNVDLGDLGINLLDGSDGLVEPGDDIQIGFVFVSSGVAPGRGVYIDDVTVTGIGKLNDDVAAVSIDIPFPIKVGEPVTFGLNVENVGLNPQTSFQWQGTVMDADGNPVANVVGAFSGTLDPDSTVTVPAITTWTPDETGVFSIEATVNLFGDGDLVNNTTELASDDPDGFEDARYSPFYVCDENLLFSSKLNDLGDDPTAASLLDEGFLVRSNSDPGVVTWQTTSSALVPFVNLGVDYAGAYVLFDSLARPQDEELIIPNLDMSHITSNATLAFKAIGVQGFTYSRFSVGVSNDGGHSWNDVLTRVRGIDPQTGTDFGGPAFRTLGLRPAVVDITPYAAGQWNVWIRFRYQGIDDGDFAVWDVAVCGQGLLAAELLSVEDVPEDNGKQVRLTWTASPNDGQIDGVPITEYGIWRGVVGSAGDAVVGDDVIRVENRRTMISNIKDLKPGTRFLDTQTQQQWDFVGSVLAHSDPEYNFVAPTLVDEVDTPFMVSAHTANPLVFANSNVVSGFSVDNLAPGVPAEFVAEEIPFDAATAVQLTWAASEDEDFQFFSLYKNGELVLQTIDLSYVDPDVNVGDTPTYDLTATDFAGNESEAAEATLTVTSIDDKPINAIPTEFAISQNYPNPFNPQTTIEYQLPKETHVTILIFDMLGRRVRTLISSDIQAGYHRVVWDARDDLGNTVSSGVYFYKIKTKEFSATNKMVLLR